MNRCSLISGAALAVLLPGTAIADDQHVIVQVDSLKWTATAPVLPKGARPASRLVFRCHRASGKRHLVRPIHQMYAGIGQTLALLDCSFSTLKECRASIRGQGSGRISCGSRTEVRSTLRWREWIRTIGSANVAIATPGFAPSSL